MITLCHPPMTTTFRMVAPQRTTDRRFAAWAAAPRVRSKTATKKSCPYYLAQACPERDTFVQYTLAPIILHDAPSCAKSKATKVVRLAIVLRANTYNARLGWLSCPHRYYSCATVDYGVIIIVNTFRVVSARAVIGRVYRDHVLT